MRLIIMLLILITIGCTKDEVKPVKIEDVPHRKDTTGWKPQQPVNDQIIRSEEN